MKYQTILFDMDGTILDTLEDLQSSVNHMREKYGYPPCSLDEVRRFVGNGARVLMRRALPELMAALDVLAARKTPPADRQELKRVLSRLPEALDYDAAARTLALADPRWNSQPALYAALRLSREPYLPAQLAVTSAELTAAHIRGGRQAWVLRGLLDAVIAAPQINFPEALLALAKTLAGQA